MPADRAGPRTAPLRVSTLELFFDLVFAFTLTQLSALLDGSHLSAASIAQVLLVFGVLWWMYGGYAWLTNARTPDRTPERLLLLLGMAGFLVVGVAIRNGFGNGRSATQRHLPRPRLPGRGVRARRPLLPGEPEHRAGSLPVNLSLGTAGPAGRADQRRGRVPAVDGGAGHPGAVPAGGAGRRPVRDRARRISPSGAARSYEIMALGE